MLQRRLREEATQREAKAREAEALRVYTIIIKIY
jgi:hypothetical protein